MNGTEGRQEPIGMRVCWRCGEPCPIDALCPYCGAGARPRAQGVRPTQNKAAFEQDVRQ